MFFAFSAVVTPDPGPVRHDRAGDLPLRCSTSPRSGWRSSTTGGVGAGKEVYAGLDDDEVSPLELDTTRSWPGSGSTRQRRSAPPSRSPRPAPIERRYDDMT